MIPPPDEFHGDQFPHVAEMWLNLRRNAKREAAATMGAIHILHGESVLFLAADPEEAERTRQRALAIADDLDRILGER